MSSISLDRQLVTRPCPGCGAEVDVVRGSAYSDGEPFALYLIGLHGHTSEGRRAHLAVAIRTCENSAVAAAMDAWEQAEQVAFSVVDWQSSPWQTESYLGAMLDREAVLASPHKERLFEVADHVVTEIPEVREYFGG